MNRTRCSIIYQKLPIRKEGHRLPIKEILRKVDKVGRVSVPSSIAKELDFEENTPVLLYIENKSTIVIKKYEQKCVCCGSSDIVYYISDIGICAHCRNQKENINKIIENRYEKHDFPKDRRLVIPFKIRHCLNIQTGDELKIRVKNNYIEIEKVTNEKQPD
jgi:bifunctional DNA-binding transcriptional regulator/antitoxin component of YhaV-PrlF toxin-antitoxin module